MYCPKCATQNTDDASYCRACGTDISLVTEALTGRVSRAGADAQYEESLSTGRSGKISKRGREAPTIEKGIEEIFLGAAFLIIFLAGLLFFRGGFMIWVWFIIPALACIGPGIGKILRAKREEQNRALPSSAASSYRPDVASAPRLNTLEPSKTSELLPTPPTSVTEGTTKLLGADDYTGAYGDSAEHSRDARIK